MTYLISSIAYTFTKHMFTPANNNSTVKYFGPTSKNNVCSREGRVVVRSPTGSRNKGPSRIDLPGRPNPVSGPARGVRVVDVTPQSGRQVVTRVYTGVDSHTPAAPVRPLLTPVYSPSKVE